MDANYISGKLIKLAKLFYGKDSDCYAKEKDGMYIFGSKKKKNKVTKEFAIYLAIDHVPSKK